MKIKTRINPIIAIFMLGTALIYDGSKAFIELITFGFLGWLINPFINIWATMTFWFWFTFLGVKFMKSGKMMGTKIVGMSAPSFIGLLPWVGSLPYWTSGVYVNLVAVYAEDLLEALTPQTLGVMANIARRAGKKTKSESSLQKPEIKKDKSKQKIVDIKNKKKTEVENKTTEENKDKKQEPENKTTPTEENKKTEDKNKKQPRKDEGQGENPAPGETEPVRDYTQQTENQTTPRKEKQGPSERENFAAYLDELAKRKGQEQGYPEYNEDLGEIIYPDEGDKDWPIAV